MNGRTDLTRWNRARLTRFRYVDGNAVTYLEELRRALAERFAGRWSSLQADAAGDETDGERLARLRDQYHRERGDWGWEIARALARACHVLTGHLEAYANEGYLGTASQWNNVRRLVESLDYRPAPPASAATRLVLEAKGKGTVEQGFQVRHTPAGGGPPVIFETLEDLEVDPALDALRLAGWNRSVATFSEEAPTPETPIGGRPVIDLQGVGKVYARRLDRLRQLETGLPGAAFTIADFRRLDPARAIVDVPRLRLREFKGKAEVLLGFPWHAARLAALLDLTLPAALALDTEELARRSSRPAAEMERLRGDLRRVQITLDEPAFAATRLRELVSGGGAAPAAAWAAPEGSGISAGQLGLVVREAELPEAAVVFVDEVEASTGALTLSNAGFQPGWRDWTRGETSLLVKPGFLRRPRLNGPGVVPFEEAHGLAAGDVAAWREDGVWRFARVLESDEQAVRIGGDARPALAAEVFRAFAIARGDQDLLFPDGYRAAARPAASGFVPLTPGDYAVETSDEGSYRKLLVAGVMEIFLVSEGAAAAGRVAAATPGKYAFDGKPGDLVSGCWVVADDGRRLWPLRIVSVEEREDHFVVSFGTAPPPPRPAAARPTTDVQGVGFRFSKALAAAGVTTFGDLAALDVLELPEIRRVASESLERSFPLVRLWEFRTKAQVILGFEGDAEELAAALDYKLADLLKMPAEDLAELVALPAAETAAVRDDLRMLEACLVEPAFREIRLRELLPAAAGTAPPAAAGTAGPDQLVRLYGLFEHALRPRGWNRNETPLASEPIPGETGHRLSLDLAGEVPGLLARGRNVVIEREIDGSYSGARVEVVTDAKAGTATLSLSKPLEEKDGFTLGNTVVRGNVAAAGHGEAKPEKVLGSGEATRSQQSFVLAEKGVSFVADATQPSGVRAAVAVRVEGRTWEQVASLRDSGPADAHYTVHMTEEGYLRIGFGDGRHGRRLPTGGGNVRVAFRLGSGLAGNLAAGSLTKAARPHRLVKAVRQPLAATGGNDMESARSLRDNAPASVLTLERAVSAGDFAHLAGRQSSVWQARAFSRPTDLGRRDSIEVVVVPAGGGALGGLEATLEEFLKAHALPGVDVRVSEAATLAFDLAVTARVKSAEYDPVLVLQEVRRALLAAFSLERRRLGQDLFLSEVYQVVEGVAGVESSLCVVAGDAALRRREAAESEVFYLDPASSEISLRHEEWTL